MRSIAIHPLPLSPPLARLCRGLMLLALSGLLFLTGCATTTPASDPKISTGMGPAAVTAVLGEPARREQFAPDRFVYFYTSGPYRDRPLCFDKGRVVHIGAEPLAAWRDERMAVASKGQGEPSDKAKARVRATLEAERAARIAELERQVKPLPVTATARNLKLYSELLRLDPENTRYQRKVAFYRQRYAAEQARQRQAVEQAAKQKQEAARQRRNKELRVYEGNETVQIAVHELGRGEIYLWVKNLADHSLLLAASQYRLLDESQGAIALTVAAELRGTLAGGGIAYGKVSYEAGKEPRRLVFEHPKAGMVEKWFP